MATALALALGAQQTGIPQAAPQQAGPQQTAMAELPNAPQQQQTQVPDAPKPQTLGLGPVAPGKGTTPTNNGETSGSNPTIDPDQPPVGSSLPGAKPMPDETQDTAPETPQVGSKAYLLPTIGVNSIEVPFTVKDNKGKLVPGLSWREVQVYENNVRQKMTVFTVDPYPLSVAMVIDQSLPVDVMTRVNNALGALPGAFSPYDEVAVFTYNNGPKMLTDFTGGQSTRLIAAVDRAHGSGRENMYFAPGEALGQSGINLNDGAESHEVLTGNQPGSPNGVRGSQVPRDVHTLNDAILMAAQSLTKAAKGRRRIVYVISDGKEYGSTAKSKDVIKYLQENRIEVIATLVGDASVAGMGFIDTVHLPFMMRDNILPVYTKATGGEFYADYRTKAIESSFARITEDMRTQYTVWYNSREPMIDGKFRRLEVRVLRPHLQVIAKDGYYPSAVAQRPASPPPIANSATP
jgi:VWFA-related protein